MNELIKVAEEFARAAMATRIVFRFVAARGRSNTEGMGAWDGEEHHWPEMRDFTFSGEKFDRFGDAYEGSYQFTDHSGDYLDLFVAVAFARGHRQCRLHRLKND